MKLAIIGAGRIGLAIYKLLKSVDYAPYDNFNIKISDTWKIRTSAGRAQ